MAADSRRLSILTAREIDDLYGLPRFKGRPNTRDTSRHPCWIGTMSISSCGERRTIVSDPDTLIAEIARLHRAIHRHDPPAVSERERQAAIVLTGLQRVILDLVSQSVHPTTLETALSYHWLRMATLTRRLDEALFDAWSSDLGGVMQSVGLELRALAAELPDDEPPEQMRALCGKVQQLRELYGGLLQQPLPPRAEIERMTDLTNRALFGFARECLDQAIDPALLESSYLYYWVRTSTIRENVPERLFQKLERHWANAYTRVDALVQRLARAGQQGLNLG